MCRELLSSQTAEQLKASAANGDTAIHLAVRRKDVDMVSKNFHPKNLLVPPYSGQNFGGLWSECGHSKW